MNRFGNTVAIKDLRKKVKIKKEKVSWVSILKKIKKERENAFSNGA